MIFLILKVQSKKAFFTSFQYEANIQPNQTFEDNLLMTPNKCLIECKQVDLRFGLLLQGSVMIAVEQ